MSRLIGLGLLLAGLLYPFAVYFGMEHFAPWQFALLLGSLWLARALNVELVGIDVSATAIRLATERRHDFVPADRARFTVGSLETTGLPDAHAHGLLCVDALCNAIGDICALYSEHECWNYLKDAGFAPE